MGVSTPECPGRACSQARYSLTGSPLGRLSLRRLTGVWGSVRQSALGERARRLGIRSRVVPYAAFLCVVLRGYGGQYARVPRESVLAGSVFAYG